MFCNEDGHSSLTIEKGPISFTVFQGSMRLDESEIVPPTKA